MNSLRRTCLFVRITAAFWCSRGTVFWVPDRGHAPHYDRDEETRHHGRDDAGHFQDPLLVVQRALIWHHACNRLGATACRRVPAVVPGPWLEGCRLPRRGDWSSFVSLSDSPNGTIAGTCAGCAERVISSPHRSNFTDCCPAGAGMTTRRAHESYCGKLETRGLAMCAISMNMLGLRLKCVMVDVLYTVDLGLAQNIIGNIMKERMSHHQVTLWSVSFFVHISDSLDVVRIWWVT